MQVSGQFDINVARDEVFRFVSRPDRLAQCIPGCSNLVDLGSDTYTALLEVEVAFLKLRFDVTVKLAEVEEPTRLKAAIHGKPKALAGKLTGVAELFLKETENSATNIRFVLDQSVTGKLGAIGQSVFRAKCEESGSLFASNLKKAIETSWEALS